MYVASSWRNAKQPDIVSAIRLEGHEVYDFRNPEPGNNGFHWSAISPEWKQWDPVRFRDALGHPIAFDGFQTDFQAMQWADAFVLVHPCGRSAHLEAGWAIGSGRPTCVLLADGEPELMLRMADFLAVVDDEMLDWLDRVRRYSGYAGDDADPARTLHIASRCNGIVDDTRVAPRELLDALRYIAMDHAANDIEKEAIDWAYEELIRRRGWLWKPPQRNRDMAATA